MSENGALSLALRKRTAFQEAVNELNKLRADYPESLHGLTESKDALDPANSTHVALMLDLVASLTSEKAQFYVPAEKLELHAREDVLNMIIDFYKAQEVSQKTFMFYLSVTPTSLYVVTISFENGASITAEHKPLKVG
jgi:hypothetical protein